MKQVSVFCAASAKVDPTYFQSAEKLSEELVKAGYNILYGGGSVGLMGAIADKALELGGSITGIIPRFMVEVEWEHKGVTNMIHTETMAERKKLLIENTNAIIVLPGSIGTMEELFEVLSLKKLGSYFKPVILLNTNGFFDSLIEILHKMVDERFMREEHGELWQVCNHPEEIPELIASTPDWRSDAIRFAAV